jgi:hypothetical protein
MTGAPASKKMTPRPLASWIVLCSGLVLRSPCGDPFRGLVVVRRCRLPGRRAAGLNGRKRIACHGVVSSPSRVPICRLAQLVGASRRISVGVSPPCHDLLLQRAHTLSFHFVGAIAPKLKPRRPPDLRLCLTRRSGGRKRTDRLSLLSRTLLAARRTLPSSLLNIVWRDARRNWENTSEERGRSRAGALGACGVWPAGLGVIYFGRFRGRVHGSLLCTRSELTSLGWPVTRPCWRQ